MSYSTDDEVRNRLGPIGNRLPTWISLPAFRSTAYADVVDRLARVYPDGIPTFTGAGLTLVASAEAKLATAEILEALRVNLPDLGDAPDRLKSSAYAALDDGVVGYPVGSVDAGSPSTPGAVASPAPRVSSFTPLSAVEDPYAEARDDAFRFQ